MQEDTMADLGCGKVAIALWEIAMISARRKVEFDRPVEEWLERGIAQPKIRLSPLTPAIAAASVSLEMHGDPADRLIVATALCLGMPLVTSDRKIRDSGLVKTIW